MYLFSLVKKKTFPMDFLDKCLTMNFMIELFMSLNWHFCCFFFIELRNRFGCILFNGNLFILCLCLFLIIKFLFHRKMLIFFSFIFLFLYLHRSLIGLVIGCWSNSRGVSYRIEYYACVAHPRFNRAEKHPSRLNIVWQRDFNSNFS